MSELEIFMIAAGVIVVVYMVGAYAAFRIGHTPKNPDQIKAKSLLIRDQWNRRKR